MKGLQLVLAAILLAVLSAQWLFWSPEVRLPDGAPEVEPGNAGGGLGAPVENGPPPLPPLEEYAEIADRPLFFEGRKVPEDEPQAAVAVVETSSDRPLNIDLTGILFVDGVQYALVMDRAAKVTRRLKLGDEFGGWSVDEIAEDKVVISSGNRREEILLWEYKPVPLPTASKKRAPGRQGVPVPEGQVPERRVREPLKK